MTGTEHLAIEKDGWVRWMRSGYGILNVRIRFKPDPGGRLVAREVRTVFEDGLQAAMLRVPLARLERWVNRPDVADLVLEANEGAEARRQRIGPRIAVPTRKGRKPYPDSFYRRLAVIVAAGHSARAIAEASGVPTTTVTRWIKGSRQRGFLKPSRSPAGEDR
jgi:hypothetical protein